MLRITSRALTIIRRVTGHPSLAPTAGLRIAQGEEPDAPLQVRAAPEPEAEDQVAERDGGRIFLGPGVAEQIADSDLDTTTDDDGRVQFVVRAP